MTDPVTLGEGEFPTAEFDEKRAEDAVRELLIAVGEDPDREGLRETPARVMRAYKELFAGLHQRPEDVLTTTFDLGHDEMVLVKDIEVFSTCEHHLVPFHGVAHVGYIPSADGKITVEFAECLGQCEGAPAVLINDVGRRDVTPEKVESLLAELRGAP